jgi:hypothetical protein
MFARVLLSVLDGPPAGGTEKPLSLTPLPKIVFRWTQKPYLAMEALVVVTASQTEELAVDETAPAAMRLPPW